jgi:hypothetical protein
LWFDAADTTTITDTNSNVETWLDKSENSYTLYNLVQTNEVNQPTTETNSYNAYNIIDFLSTDNMETNVPFSSSNDFTINMVVNIESVFDENSTLLEIGGTSDPSFKICAGNNSNFYISFVQTEMGENKTFLSNPLIGMNILTFNFNYQDNILEVFVNGNSVGTTSYASPPAQTNLFKIFADSDGNNIEGSIAEIISTSGQYSTEDKTNIENYLSEKWRISLQ